jgi:hypothetical protein
MLKNDERTQNVYENKGKEDKISDYLTGFLPKIHRFRGNGRQSSDSLAKNAPLGQQS